MREGMAARIVQPKVVDACVPAQIARQITEKATTIRSSNPSRSPASITAVEQERLKIEVHDAIKASIEPAFRDFRNLHR